MFTLEGPSSVFYATPESAGFDIRANEACILEPGQFRAVGTGLRITQSAAAPNDALTSVGSLTSPCGKTCRILPELQIRPRSGLAAKSGITVLNAPGTIDADYRGEIKVILINHSRQSFKIEVGDRIAQGVCQLCVQLPQLEVGLNERGEGGFGSTGHA